MIHTWTPLSLSLWYPETKPWSRGRCVSVSVSVSCVFVSVLMSVSVYVVSVDKTIQSWQVCVFVCVF